MILLRFSVDEQQYEIDVTRILNTEAIAVQKVTGYNYDEWLAKCDENDRDGLDHDEAHASAPRPALQRRVVPHA